MNLKHIYPNEHPRKAVRTMLLLTFALILTVPSPLLKADSNPATDALSSSPDTPRALALRSRTLTPSHGVESGLARLITERVRENKPYVHLIAHRQSFPDPQTWAVWAHQGIHRAAFLGDRAWILRVELESDHDPEDAHALLERIRQQFDATALTLLRPKDKTSPELLHDQSKGISHYLVDRLLSVTVIFFPDMPPPTVISLLDEVHQGPGPPKELDTDIWQAEIQPSDLRTLLGAEEVQFVDRGPLPKLPLMDQMRLVTGADVVQGIAASFTPPEFSGYSGSGIRVSNSEGLFVDHDDFWNHNANGSRTTPRWIDCENGSSHGAMTAGIILGNGWQSASRGTVPYAWRGMAPQALLDCYHHEPDISNHSFVQSYGSYNSTAYVTDRRIRGDSSSNFHPAVGAVANQGIDSQYGIEIGYYSVYRNAKNEIIVGNVNATDFQWNFSSLGPTWDGRIKPDLVAPGSRASFPDDRANLLLDFDYLEIAGSGRSEKWTFDASTLSWHGGWGDHSWWGRQNIGPVSQINEGLITALRVPLQPPPWGKAFRNRPIIGTLTRPDFQSRLSLDGATGDRVALRYRADAGEYWPYMTAQFSWATNPELYKHHSLSFPLIPDGKWHTATLDLGNHPSWVNASGVDYLYLRFSGPAMPVPGANNGYGAAGGSSASAPVVTGALALLLEQVVDLFGVRLGDHSNSPFQHRLRGKGVPLASTWKAILVHTARDLASRHRAWEPPNPDTGAPTVYHDGPDLVTGYGLLNVAEASRLVRAEAEAQQTSGGAQPHYIVEDELNTASGHIYGVEVSENRLHPLKVTLAWDDSPGSLLIPETSPKLVNDLDLLVKGPDDSFYYPWSIDLPYEPTGPGQAPGAVEPEPISATSIRPARRDRLNHRDNLEQVVVEFPEPGQWQVYVLASGLGAPPQKYSIILDSPPSSPSQKLSGGKVAFVSNRVDPPQLFVQEVNSSDPPQQISFGHFPAAHPAWSPDGRYVAYVTEDIFVGSAPPVDVLEIVTPQGTRVASFYALSWFGEERSRYPAWSPDGRKIVVTTFDRFGSRGLSILEFDTPYDFESAHAYEVISQDADSLNPADAEFSPDGRYLYLQADTNDITAGLFRIPASGGHPYPIQGNGTTIRRGYQLSVSPDGRRLAYNSELWREDPEKYLDEELLEVDLRTGISIRLTHKPGNQYGWYAQGGTGELVMQTNSAPGANNDLYLVDHGHRTLLDIADPLNDFNDHSPTWWKP